MKLRFFDGTTKTVTLDDKGDVKTASNSLLGKAFKVSGTDSNTRLDNLDQGNKYNGYYYNTTTTGKTEDALAKTVKAKEIGGRRLTTTQLLSCTPIRVLPRRSPASSSMLCLRRLWMITTQLTVTRSPRT